MIGTGPCGCMTPGVLLRATDVKQNEGIWLISLLIPSEKLSDRSPLP